MSQMPNRPIVQKYGNVDNKRLTDLARGQACTFNFPHVCNYDKDTTVSVHADELDKGKGKGLKASDEWIAWGCSACHAWLPTMPRDEREKAWFAAFKRTYHEMWKQGLLRVA